MPSSPHPASPTPKTKTAAPVAAVVVKRAAASPKTPAKENVLDIGKSLGLHDTATVRQKVRKWQVDGGGVVDPENDVIVVEEDDGTQVEAGAEQEEEENDAPAEEETPAPPLPIQEGRDGSPAPATPKTPITPARLQGVVVGANAEERSPRPSSANRTPGKTPQHNTLDKDVLVATAPKKRVISDGHWRKTRSPPKEAKAEKETPPAKKKPEVKGVWVRPAVLPRPAPVLKPKSPEPVIKSSPPKAALSPLQPKPLRVVTKKRRSMQGRSAESPIAKSDVDRSDRSGGEEFRARPTPRRRRSSAPRDENVKTPTSTDPLDDGIRVYPSRRHRKSRSSRSADEADPVTSALDAITRDLEDMTDGIRVNPSRRRRRRSHKSTSSEEPDVVPRKESLRHRKSEGDVTDHLNSNTIHKESSRHSRRHRSKDEGRYADEMMNSELPQSHKSQRGPRYSWENSPPHEESEEEDRRRRRKSDRHRSREISPASYPEREDDRRRRKSSHRKSRDDIMESTVAAESSVPSKDRSAMEKRISENRKLSYTIEHRVVSKEVPREPIREARKSSHRSSFDPEYVSRTPEAAPETPPKVYKNRIDAWLNGTPDPFVDDDSPAPSAVSEPAKRKVDMTELSSSKDTAVTSDVTISTQERPTSSRRRQRSRTVERVVETSDIAPSSSLPATPDGLDPEIEVEYASTTSVPSLKRSGARRNMHSPTKERPKSSPLATPPTLQEDDAASSVGSSVDPSTIKLPHYSPTPAPKINSYPLRRPFPSTGKRLSTIASVETMNTKIQAPPSITEVSEITASEAVTASDVAPSVVDSTTSTAKGRGTSLKRRLTKHADLMSVLSMPQSHSRTVISARSIRTNRSRLEDATVDDIMNELASDEVKYARELRTTVDGVIPVLLQCVLSKTDSAKAAGLFSRTLATQQNPQATKPIVDMGIALERLKSWHRRLPLRDHDALVVWAQGALKVYEDYINVWRLGFQDVVINLAPLRPDKLTEKSVWDDGLPRNEKGDIVNGNGERVDVAFLLKRPLVRLKNLGKTVKGLAYVTGDRKAEELTPKWEKLLNDARKRVKQEKERIEDEEAASIDPTRARDPRSMAPVTGVRIDPSRRVQARDFFDLHLQHSSGQEMDCRVELFARMDSPGRGDGGDLLICEVDSNGRWLLFPPMDLARVSVRTGDMIGELVMMLRGIHSGGQVWQELLTLTLEDDEPGAENEWLSMLGTDPVPPALPSREKSFREPNPRPTSSHGSSLVSAVTASTLPLKSRTPSPREIEVPIGEKAGSASKRWEASTPERARENLMPSDVDASPITPPSDNESRLDSASSSLVGNIVEKKPEQRTPTKDYRGAHHSLEDTPTMRRSKPARYHLHGLDSTPRKTSRELFNDQEPGTKSSNYRPATAESAPTTPSASRVGKPKGFSVWLPSSTTGDSDSDESRSSDDEPTPMPKPFERPQLHRRASSVPSMELPSIPKLRKTSPSDRLDERAGSEPANLASAPAKVLKESLVVDALPSDSPPPPPPHRTPSKKPSKDLPVIKPTSGHRPHRRTSSPLKHEYQPSTASDTVSEDSEFDSESETSETSEDDELSDDDIPLALLPKRAANEPPKIVEPLLSPPDSLYSPPNGTLAPSQSASQAPYRAVPQQAEKATKAVASIFCWSDTKGWESLHPEECGITITPGLIEAFDSIRSRPTTSSDASSSPAEAIRPLVALELTPLVPIRRGTAVDISIRSPPTANSLLKPQGANIMFRSRSPEECEALYGLINYSRINNPTYIALQNARGPYGESSWAAAMDRRNALRTASAGGDGSSGGHGSAGGSWWQFGGSARSKSYRASSSKRALSTSAATDSSVNTVGSAFSALRRFSNSGSKVFNIAKSGASWGKSAATRVTGSSGEDSFSGGSGGSGSGTSTPMPTTGGEGKPPVVPAMSLGITNMKVRLYIRQSQSKWVDLGSARMSIMQPTLTPLTTPPQTAGGDGSPRAPTHQRQVSVSNSPSKLQSGPEKRIVIHTKNEDCLLDVTLGESCFERIARTGIAVSVWEDVRGKNGEVVNVAPTGGVADKTVKVYMIQMKTERECAYSFSLLGKLRY
ncbi:hypothetical protein K402DRAFT_421264 [Aulographum hederae CBS 113979]|uniref:Uncharacterized protein n=1 Tax=Aulographum hederae CBS 113979 TaxID=1176131 RepID=A0A6G1H027_9PEZI|nr:hypothetical protein K402DRAFT_421264 [Aulographum hederae CBS 113979]